MEDFDISNLPKGMRIESTDIPVDKPRIKLREYNYIAQIAARLEDFEDFEVDMVGTKVDESIDGTIVELTLVILPKGGEAVEEED